MTYLPGDAFYPVPIFEDREFWEYCSKKELRFQACGECGTLRHPPTPVCGTCTSTVVEWKLAPGRATIFSYTIIHHAADDRIKAALPYAVVVLEFPDFGPVKLVSNLIAGLERIHIGMQVDLIWEAAGEGLFLPRYLPTIPSDKD